MWKRTARHSIGATIERLVSYLVTAALVVVAYLVSATVHQRLSLTPFVVLLAALWVVGWSVVRVRREKRYYTHARSIIDTDSSRFRKWLYDPGFTTWLERNTKPSSPLRSAAQWPSRCFGDLTKAQQVQLVVAHCHYREHLAWRAWWLNLGSRVFAAAAVAAFGQCIKLDSIAANLRHQHTTLLGSDALNNPT